MECRVCHRVDPECGFHPGRYACKECRRRQIAIQQKGRRRGNPGRVRYYKRKYKLAKFELTEESLQQMLADLQGICKICNTAPPKGLIIDHDHATGQFRGLICNSCNLALGHAHDDINVLKSLIKYLEES